MEPDNDGWFRSSFRCSSYSNCVEVRFTAGVAEVRNSRQPDGPTLVFDRAEWDAFESGVLRGEFNMPA